MSTGRKTPPAGGVRRTRLAYYAYRVTNSAGFYVPVAILFLQDRGFGLAFVGYAYAVFAVASVLAEIPTGYLGDYLGRRGSLALGAALRVLALGAYPLVTGAAAFLALHVVWATGRAFRSGTADAWLYELLAAHGEADDYARVESRGSTALLVTSAVTAVAGGVLYGVGPGLPFFANAALAALGLPVLAVAPGVRTGGPDPVAPTDGGGDATDDGERRPGSDRFTVGDALGVLGAQVRRPGVRWLVAYAALFWALFSVTRIYEQPALDAVGVPVTGLGVLYAAFKLVSAGAAASVGWLDERLGARGVFGLLVPVYGVAYAAIAVVPALVVPALFLNRGIKTVTRPVRNQYLNDRLADEGRATVLSGAAMVLASVSALARVVAGGVVARTGAVGLLPVAGVAVAAAGGVLWLAASPVRDRSYPERSTLPT